MNNSDIYGIGEAGVRKIQDALVNYIKALNAALDSDSIVNCCRCYIAGEGTLMQLRSVDTEIKNNIHSYIRTLSEEVNRMGSVYNRYRNLDNSSSTFHSARSTIRKTTKS